MRRSRGISILTTLWRRACRRPSLRALLRLRLSRSLRRWWRSRFIGCRWRRLLCGRRCCRLRLLIWGLLIRRLSLLRLSLRRGLLCIQRNAHAQKRRQNTEQPPGLKLFFHESSQFSRHISRVLSAGEASALPKARAANRMRLIVSGARDPFYLHALAAHCRFRGAAATELSSGSVGEAP